MFIAVDHRDFDIADEANRGEQLTHYLQNQNAKGAEKTGPAWIYILPYRWFKPSPIGHPPWRPHFDLVLSIAEVASAGPQLSILSGDHSREFSTFLTSFLLTPCLLCPYGGENEGLCVISRTVA